MRCEVLRQFQATNDEWLVPGPPELPCIVDTADWREANVQRLIQRRYLRPVPEPETVPPSVVEESPTGMDTLGRFPRRGKRA